MILKPHQRVFEYDGAFSCADCHQRCGALPNVPKEAPEECVPVRAKVNVVDREKVSENTATYTVRSEDGGFSRTQEMPLENRGYAHMLADDLAKAFDLYSIRQEVSNLKSSVNDWKMVVKVQTDRAETYKTALIALSDKVDSALLLDEDLAGAWGEFREAVAEARKVLGE
jgi:hypothetical protein